MAKATHGKPQGGNIKVTRRRIASPLPTAHFRILIDQDEIGILSVSPLHWLTEGETDSELRQSVTLRRAVSQDRRLFDWYRAAVKRKEDSRDLTVVQLDCAEGKPVNIWRLQRATPVRWTGPRFDALSSEIAIEELEIRYESIDWRSCL